MLSAYSLADSISCSARLAFGDVPKDEDDPDDIPSVIFDGRCTVVDGSLAAVSGDEQSMFAELDSQPSLDNLPDRLFKRFPVVSWTM